MAQPEKVIVYGQPRCPGVPPVRGLLTLAKVPFDYVDIHQDREAARYVADLNDGYERVPTLRFPDGSTLTEPSVGELRDKLTTLGYRIGPLAWLIGNAWLIFILLGVLFALARMFELF